LNYFQKSLNKQIQNHSSLINTYYILANICLEKKNFHQALKYFLQLLDNYSYRNISHEPSLQYIYKSIANIYFQEHNYNQSLIYFYKLLDYQLQKKSIDHPSIGETYTMIGNIYLKKRHHTNTDLQFGKYHLDQTLLYFQNLLQKNITNYSLDDIYRILGIISLEKQDFNQALIFSHRLLHNQLQKNHSENPSLAQTYLTIGNIYTALGDSYRALQNYEQSLAIYQRTDPQNDSIKKVQHKINKILLPVQ